MQFTDAAVVAGTRRRDDGYLVADARIARTGIQVYRGAEVGKPDMAAVRVYRPGAEVFAADTMKSAAHRPVTNDHPPEPVTSDNWRQHAVGQTGDEIAGEGIFIRVPLMVSDEATIKLIEDGKRELSAGYTCDLDFTPGKTPAGDAYDAVQRNIRINHVAIVARGRAGSQVRIGDDASPWGAAPIHTADERKPDMPDNLRTVVVDGLSVSTTDQGAQAIEKLTKDRDDARKALADANTAHAAAVKTKDEQIGTLTAEVAKLKDAAPKPADLDRMVADRVALVTAAKAVVADLKPEGLSDADIRKAVVKAKLGDAVLEGASDDMIAGMFKAITKDVKPADPVRDALRTRDAAVTTVDQAHAAMVTSLQDAWKGQQKGAA